MQSERLRRGVAVAGLAGAMAVIDSRPTGGFTAAPWAGAGASSQHASAMHAGGAARFEANVGQFDARVAYVGRARDAILALTDDAATLVVSRAHVALRWRVDGGRPVRPVGSEALVIRSNYFVGRDPARWRAGVPNVARVTYRGVRDGVDLVYHGDGDRLEYDLVVAPGADATGLAMAVEGAQGLSLDAAGDLVIVTAGGALVQPPPRVYQQDGGAERRVRAAYRLVDDRRVAFEVAPYDHTENLVIDPDIAYATYLGGVSYDEAEAVGVDAAGSAYLAGVTTSAEFPLKNAFDPAFTGDSSNNLFVAKLDPTGSALVYATYVGGAGEGGVSSMSAFAVDPNGHAYLAGSPSADFPLKDPLQSTGSAFLLKLAQDGGLAYSTRFGGSGASAILGMAVDGSGSAYLTGETGSPDLASKGAVYSSFQGGDYDAFVAKVTPTGSAFAFSTYLGSAGTDRGYAVGVDGAGRVYVTGDTNAASFPLEGAAQVKYGGGDTDAFIASLSADGTSLLYSTFLGGSGADSGRGIAVDALGTAYVTGNSMVGSVTGPVANDFPITLGTIYSPFGDNFTARLRPGGASFAYAALGPGGGAIAVDATGRAYLTLSCGFNVLDATGATTSPVELDPSGQNCPSATSMALDSATNVYLAGSAGDAGIAPTPGAYQMGLAGGAIDAFVMKIGSNPLPDAGIRLDSDDAEAGVSDASPDGATPPGDAGGMHAAEDAARLGLDDAAAPDRDAEARGSGVGGSASSCSLSSGATGRASTLFAFTVFAFIAIGRRQTHRRASTCPRSPAERARIAALGGRVARLALDPRHVKPGFLGDGLRPGLVGTLPLVHDERGDEGRSHEELAAAGVARRGQRRRVGFVQRSVHAPFRVAVRAVGGREEFLLAALARDAIGAAHEVLALVAPRRGSVGLAAEEGDLLRDERLDRQAPGRTSRAARVDEGGERGFREGHRRGRCHTETLAATAECVPS